MSKIIWYHETKQAPDFDARIVMCDEDGTWAYMTDIEAVEKELEQAKTLIAQLQGGAK